MAVLASGQFSLSKGYMFSLQNYDLRLSLQRGIGYVDVLTGYAPAVDLSINIGDTYGAVFVNGSLYVAMPNTFPGEVKKVDPATGNVLTTIIVGNDPRGMCFDGASIWCADYDLNGPGNTVTKIDPATDTVIATLTVGAKPGFIEYDGSGSVWVACLGSSTIYKIDATTNAITPINLGGVPKSLAYDNRAYMFFAIDGTTTIKKVRTTTNAITNLTMPTAIYGMCSAGESVFATDFGTKIYKINRMTNAINTINSPASPTRRPAFDGKRVWVPCGSSEKTVIVDLSDNSIEATLTNTAGSNKHVVFDNNNAFISVDTGLLRVPLI
jgi:YVTN family beta-propeller protein